MAPQQHDRKHKKEQQSNPYDDPPRFVPVRFRTVSRELMVTIDDGMLIRVNGQKESPRFLTKLLRIIILKSESSSLLRPSTRVFTKLGNSAQYFTEGK